MHVEPLADWCRTRRSRIAALGLMATLCTASACNIWGRQGFSDLGTIVFDSDTAEISLPDSVGVGESFSVSIVTFGGGCTEEVDRTDLEIQDMVAQITPWNWNTGAQVCSRALRLLSHQVDLSFGQSGTAIIHIVGREETAQGSREIQLGRQVLVR